MLIGCGGGLCCALRHKLWLMIFCPRADDLLQALKIGIWSDKGLSQTPACNLGTFADYCTQSTIDACRSTKHRRLLTHGTLLPGLYHV
jgi:hypothetical protein